MAVNFGKFVVVWKSIGPEKENRLLMAFDTTIECNAFIYGIIVKFLGLVGLIFRDSRQCVVNLSLEMFQELTKMF